MSSTNVHGRNYGTHCQGENGRTLCKRYAQAGVNCTTRDPDQEEQASCKLCQRVRARAIDVGKTKCRHYAQPVAIQLRTMGITQRVRHVASRVRWSSRASR
jgi:hypothetical protein